MPLLSIQASKKVETTVRLEESTAKRVDQYAHFAKASADDVVNQALEYVFTKDKDFQQYLTQHQGGETPAALRIKKPAVQPPPARTMALAMVRRTVRVLTLSAPNSPQHSHSQEQQPQPLPTLKPECAAHMGKYDTSSLPGWCRAPEQLPSVNQCRINSLDLPRFL